MLKRANRQKGFTLIELLIVVAIIGIIAALLIPNFLEALQRGRSRRTIGDIRQWATALAMFYVDNGGAAAAGQGTLQVDVSNWTGTATVTEMESAMVPDYIQDIPENDAWGHTLDYNVLLQPANVFYALVRSPGLDGTFEGDTYDVGDFDPRDYDQDIVWADGTFVRSPGTANPAAGGAAP